MYKRTGYATRTTKEQRERMNNGQCPSCGKPKSKWNRRTDWRCCSIKCTNKFDKEHYLFWNLERIKVFKRDNYACAKCKTKGNEYSLIADHIVPIALGGYEWDFKNIQTLCDNCNKIKTKKDMKNITKQRRIEKKLIKGQKQIK